MIGDWNVYVILLVAFVGYMLGNVQTALIISRLRFRDDVRLYGSGNAGTTNMIRVYGKTYGLITFLGDAGKCVLAFFLGRLLASLLGLHATDRMLSMLFGGYIASAMVVVGHCYPVLYQFRGGKGAASAFAMMWCISWQTALISTVLAIVIFLLWKRVSLVSILTSILYLISTYVAWLIGFVDVFQLFFVMPVVAILLLRHKDNIKRLLRGEEKAITPKNNR